MLDIFLKSTAGRVIISIIWGLGLATLFKKVCEQGEDCRPIEYRGPTQAELNGVFTFGNGQCYKIEPYVVSC